MDGDPRRGRELETVVGLIAVIVGLALYVYLVGWIVDLVRFAAARLPAEAATAALSNRKLFGTGLRSTLLMAIAVAVACAAAYLASARNWDVHGQDWHDIMGKHGVASAADDIAAQDERHLRERDHHRRAARRAGQVAQRTRAKLIARLARRVQAHHEDSARRVEASAPRPLADRGPQDLQPAPLGDWAVRVIAGFNITLLAALIALGAGRGAGALIAGQQWIGIVVGVLAFLVVHWLLTRSSPLLLDARIHAVIWGAIGLATLFASAPVGVLALTAVGIATLGRALARVPQPHSPAQFLRSPLPWALVTICLLLGLAYSATPPVAFDLVTVTGSGESASGGFVNRTSAGVYLATCTALADATSTGERLELVPAGAAQTVRVGGADYLDSGQRPSLAALALHALGIGGQPPTLFSAALRATRPTCAGAGPASLTTGTEDPALGSGVIAGPAPPGGVAHDGEPPIQDTTPRAIAALALRYQPTLLVTVADRNWPVSVGAMLDELGPKGQTACLIQARVPDRVCAPTLTESTLAASGATASDYLQLPVMLGANQSPSGQFQAFLRGQFITSGSLHAWLSDPGVLDPWYTAQIYFYQAGPISIQRFPKQALIPQLPPRVFALEYWFYYQYNYFPLVFNSDLMDQAPIAGDDANVDLHQGDWEHVDVLLDPRTLAPEWLYMARHSYEGQFVPWSSPSLRFDQGHPVIQAAFGGHPSYLPGCGARPRPVTHDLTSDWLSCGSGRYAFRAATTPLVDIAKTPWACWPGHFGEATRLEVQHADQPENVADSVKHFVFVAGPSSPLQQAENEGICRGGVKAIEQVTALAAKPRAR
ncbi:MAG: hypothetical protein ABSG43_08610 [Solirubrobacteraceae bacterium]